MSFVLGMIAVPQGLKLSFAATALATSVFPNFLPNSLAIRHRRERA